MLPALCIAAVVLSACSKPDTASPSQTPTPAAPAATAPAVPKPVPAVLPDVLAHVNGETIGKAEFLRALQTFEQRAGGEAPPDQRDKVYRELLDELIGYRLLQQEARSRQIAATDSEINARVNDIRQQLGGGAKFRQELSVRKLTLDAFKDQIRSDIQIAKILEAEVEGAIRVEPDDVARYYEQNPEEFKVPEQLRASHIFIKMPENTDPGAKASARAKAIGLLKRIKSGEDFATLARQHSEDPSNAQYGGEIGYFTRGKMLPPFEKAVWSLHPGEISDVVETDRGFHIIKVADRQKARTVPLDEARPQLEELLKARQRNEKTTAVINALKAKGKVEILI